MPPSQRGIWVWGEEERKKKKNAGASGAGWGCLTPSRISLRPRPSYGPVFSWMPTDAPLDDGKRPANLGSRLYAENG